MECLQKSDSDQLEKLISFSRSIPGFEYISKSQARKIFNLFTLQRVQKGWNTNCQSHDSQSTTRKLYIITKGSFAYRSYNKQIPTGGPS